MYEGAAAKPCADCKNTGMKEQRMTYPWGGTDIKLVFCHCQAGKKEEKEYHDFHNAIAEQPMTPEQAARNAARALVGSLAAIVRNGRPQGAYFTDPVVEACAKAIMDLRARANTEITPNGHQ